LSTINASALIVTNDWIRYENNPVIEGTPNEWDGTGVRNPCVLKIDDTYLMYYMSSEMKDGENHIGLATSSDGMTWTKEASNPVLRRGTGWESFRISSPMVIFDDGVYKMWYTGTTISFYYSIGYATSTDGITWTKYSSDPVFAHGTTGEWNDRAVSSPYVLKEDGIYKMWYTGRNYATNQHRIGYATSTDGINWVDHPSSPIIDIGEPGSYDDLAVSNPTIIVADGKYHMWYQAVTTTEESTIAYASSVDGLVWEKSADNPVLEPLPGTNWENSFLGAPSVLESDGILEMWYTGRTVDNPYYMTVGYATMISSPERAIEGLIDDVSSMDLQHGIEKGLVSKLEIAMKQLDNGNENVAINLLTAFINQVEDQRDNKITNEQADFLIEQAQKIITMM
jgi:predicted GH43/DUF377 family glycosyl hydrolase